MQIEFGGASSCKAEQLVTTWAVIHALPRIASGQWLLPPMRDKYIASGSFAQSRPLNTYYI